MQTLFLLVIFSLIALQNFLGYFLQVRQYQKVIRKWLGKGVLGVGQRRGLFSFGELLVLVYNAHEKKVITVQSLRGLSVFSRFREITAFTGLTLEELRRRNVRPNSALIQAVDAVEKLIKKEQNSSQET
jgi:DNA-binding transcriptional regulator of glucitol operon